MNITYSVGDLVHDVVLGIVDDAQKVGSHVGKFRQTIMVRSLRVHNKRRTVVVVLPFFFFFVVVSLDSLRKVCALSRSVQFPHVVGVPSFDKDDGRRVVGIFVVIVAFWSSSKIVRRPSCLPDVGVPFLVVREGKGTHDRRW